ncbi:hypothetical protein [Streptosporangium sp. NPDC001681]|uniref:hypothetical protein n=1 Tax=Streptosporangium sp. NPDC001681 TaxID=3154395 RepID=UPI003321906E
MRAQGEDVAGAWVPTWLPACLAGPAGCQARSAANRWSRLVFCAGYMILLLVKFGGKVTGRSGTSTSADVLKPDPERFCSELTEAT